MFVRLHMVTSDEANAEHFGGLRCIQGWLLGTGLYPPILRKCTSLEFSYHGPLGGVLLCEPILPIYLKRDCSNG